MLHNGDILVSRPVSFYHLDPPTFLLFTLLRLRTPWLRSRCSAIHPGLRSMSASIRSQNPPTGITLSTLVVASLLRLCELCSNERACTYQLRLTCSRDKGYVENKRYTERVAPVMSDAKEENKETRRYFTARRCFAVVSTILVINLSLVCKFSLYVNNLW